MKLSGREKAAFLFGMTVAYKKSQWPNIFGKPDRVKWVQYEIWAHQMLTGGVYNPLNAFTVQNQADEELKGLEGGI